MEANFSCLSGNISDVFRLLFLLPASCFLKFFFSQVIGFSQKAGDAGLSGWAAKELPGSMSGWWVGFTGQWPRGFSWGGPEGGVCRSVLLPWSSLKGLSQPLGCRAKAGQSASGSPVRRAGSQEKAFNILYGHSHRTALWAVTLSYAGGQP